MHTGDAIVMQIVPDVRILEGMILTNSTRILYVEGKMLSVKIENEDVKKSAELKKEEMKKNLK